MTLRPTGSQTEVGRRGVGWDSVEYVDVVGECRATTGSYLRVRREGRV